MSSGAADGIRIAGVNVSSIGVRVAVAGLVFGVLSRVLGPQTVAGPAREVIEQVGQAGSAARDSSAAASATVSAAQSLRAMLSQIQPRVILQAVAQHGPETVGTVAQQIGPSLIYAPVDGELNRLLRQPIQGMHQGELGPSAQQQVSHHDLLPYFTGYVFKNDAAFVAQMNDAWRSIQNIEVSNESQPYQIIEAFQYLLAQQRPTRGTMVVHSARTSQFVRENTELLTGPMALFSAVGRVIGAGVTRLQNGVQRGRADWDAYFGSTFSETIPFRGTARVRAHSCEVLYPSTYLSNPVTWPETRRAIDLVRREGCLRYTSPTLIAPDVFAQLR